MALKMPTQMELVGLFRASCRECDWLGPVRRDKSRAENDAWEHTCDFKVSVPSQERPEGPMATDRRCDLCRESITNEHATYDLSGRYRFKLVVAQRLSWWRSRKETHDLDVCADCVRKLGRAVVVRQGVDES